ncbi:MAG: DUF2232 domain-containing protein [Firmicutes bacterium]|nr:DUF2232 domain-containing protein [Bacillota bacterium]
MEQNQSFGKKLADALALLLFGLVLLFGGMYIPLIGIFAVFLLVMPVALAVYRDGLGYGIALSIIFGGLVLAFSGFPDGIVTFGAMTILALFYGISFCKKVSAGKTLLGGIFIGILLAAAYFAYAYLISGVTIAELRSAFETELAAMYNVYVESGLLDAALTEGLSVEAYINKLVVEMVQILPSFLVIVVMAIAAVNYIVAQYVLRKRSADILGLPPFCQWHLPWWILWGVVVALACFVGGNLLDLEILLIIAKNILICYVPILLIAGISLVRYFLVQWNVSNGFQVLLWIVALLFMSVSAMFFVLIGAGDAAIDYRSNLMKKKKNDVGGHTK